MIYIEKYLCLSVFFHIRLFNKNSLSLIVKATTFPATGLIVESLWILQKRAAMVILSNRILTTLLK